MKHFFRVEYIFIFLAIIWPSFGGKFHIDQAERMVDLLMVASWCVMLPKKSFLVTSRSPISISMGLWMIYVIVQFTFLHSPDLNKDIFIHYFSLLKVYTIMMIVQRDVLKGNVHRLFILLIVAYFIYSFSAFIFVGGTIDINNRTTIQYINDPNDVSFSICICELLLIIEFFTKKISLGLLLFATLVEFYMIMGLGSRTAFCVMFLIFILSVFIALKKRKVKMIFVVSLIIVGTCLFANFEAIMGSTMIGQRIIDTSEQSSFNTGTILDYMGDRGPFYFFGFQEFLDHPIFGIGLKNFGANNVYNEFACHSEYMVNLAETGAVGAVLFITFIFCLTYCLIKVKAKFVPFDKLFLILCYVIPMFIALFFWTYDRSYIFVQYGLIGGFYLKTKYTPSCKY